MSKINILSLMLLASTSLWAQKLAFPTFMERVSRNNISYLAEKYNVNIAEANVQAAKVFNDPSFGFTYSNNDDHKMQMGQSFEGELAYDLPLANVRGARISVAKTEKELAEASIAHYFRNLKADATIMFYNALLQKKMALLAEESYRQMADLAKSDSVRLALGEGTETDAMQSKLEAQGMYNDFLQAQADYQNALTELSAAMGDTLLSVPCDVEGELSFHQKPYLLNKLFEEAEANRTDLQVAILGKSLSEKNLRLLKAERAGELGLSLGFAHSTIVRNEIAPAPAFNSLSVGISIPLKLSNLNKGQVKAAKLEVEQQKTNLEAARLQIRNEVKQAYNNYNASARIASRYSTSIIEQASTILKNRTYGYRQGESSLLEVLEAQRTYTDMLKSYEEAVFNALEAEVEISRATGL